jgi:hypothetical protein
MRSARLTSDTLQERAVMVVGLERGDLNVLNAWFEKHPGDSADVKELDDIRWLLNSAAGTFQCAMSFAPPL